MSDLESFRKLFCSDSSESLGLSEEFISEVVKGGIHKIINKRNKIVVISGLVSMELDRIPHRDQGTIHFPISDGIVHKREIDAKGEPVIKTYPPQFDTVYFPAESAMILDGIAGHLGPELPEVLVLGGSGYTDLTRFTGNLALKDLVSKINELKN